MGKQSVKIILLMLVALFGWAGNAEAIQITILNEGSGSDYGQVTSIPAAITCEGKKYDGSQNTACTGNFAAGVGVDLNALVNKTDGAFFAGWTIEFLPAGKADYVQQTNMCLGLDPSCHVTVPFNVDDIRVRAAFNLQFILTLRRDGSGSGVITANTDNNLQTICTATLCSQTYDNGRIVTLTANATNSSVFKTWVGSACTTGTNSAVNPICTITMDQAKSVTAVFDPVNPSRFDLALIKEGSGSDYGTVVSVGTTTDPVNCGGGSSDCTGNFASGQGISLQATSSNGATFSRWQVYFLNNDTPPKYILQPNMCTGLEPTCAITMASYAQVRAQFDLGFILTVVRDGTGTGKVVSNSPDLDACTANICNQTFNQGKALTLTAVADSSARFSRWTGCDSVSGDNGEICSVSMSKAKLVTSTFESVLSLTVVKAGTGLGDVLSGDGDLKKGEINCGAQCSANFSIGKGVTLTAKPSADSRFKGWSGVCSSSGAQPICTVTITGAAQLVGAEFEAVSGPQLSVTVSKNTTSPGLGKITSNPTGIECTSDNSPCLESYSLNTLVTLTATPDASSAFSGWGGECSNRGKQLTCNVTMDQAANSVKSVTASFEQQVNKLTVNKEGDGAGDVISAPAGINCGSTCSASFGSSEPVALTATAPAGSVFLGWSGSCSGQSTTCFVTMDQTRSVTAKFSPGFKLSVVPQGDGFGTVVSNPSGISCDGTCTAGYLKNTAVSLTANAIGGSQFVNWGGACSGNQPTCLVKLTGDQNVTVNFKWLNNPATLPKAISKLNDTGIDWCSNNSAIYIANKDAMCSSMQASHPNQDGNEGRDVYARQGMLPKIGNGDAGFDFTKICNSGQLAGQGNCPLLPVLGGGDNDWGCTRDNVTNLIWEVKTEAGLRNKDAAYSWFESSDQINGGVAGDDCSGSTCNTEKYVQTVNGAGLCGSNDWRLPSRQELHSIVHHGRSKPSIDITYFPNTAPAGYWTATPVAAQTFNAWYINFETGWDYWENKSNQQRIRLVRQCLECEPPVVLPKSAEFKSDGRLIFPAVDVDGKVFSAKLKMVNSNPLTFSLVDAQDLNRRAGRSANPEQVSYSSTDQRVAVGGVVVGNDRYNATMQLVPGSNPLQFVVTGAKLSK